MASPRPNVLFVFGDQWRAQAAGYAGNPDVRTPNLDALAERSVNFTNAVAGCPVCCPYRASLLTGQYPLTHGVFVNDVHLDNSAVSIAQAFARAGYDTAYVGKWHVDGQGRGAYIPPDRQQGFDYWKALECTHDYNDSKYYEAGCPDLEVWNGYDAIAQTRDVQDYIRDHAESGKPFFAVLSWGPPHNPYHTAPEQYREMYSPDDIRLRPNVPEEKADRARGDLAGYYAHCTALDDCVGALLTTLEEEGIAEDTVFVFTSDHGDMLGSQGMARKQKFWDESVRVPFLLRWPRLGTRVVQEQIDAPDIMPTLLGLCGVQIPDTVEGRDLSPLCRGEDGEIEDTVLLNLLSPFGEWHRNNGGYEYRGVRTERYTYVRSLKGPEILYDNLEDPYQQSNLVDKPEMADVQAELEARLARMLEKTNDEFPSGDELLARWGYLVDEGRTTHIGGFPENVPWEKYKPVWEWWEEED